MTPPLCEACGGRITPKDAYYRTDLPIGSHQFCFECAKCIAAVAQQRAMYSRLTAEEALSKIADAFAAAFKEHDEGEEDDNLNM